MDSFINDVSLDLGEFALDNELGGEEDTAERGDFLMEQVTLSM